MKYSQKRIRLCTCLLIINLIFIWGNSLMPGEISSRISGWVGELVKNLLNLPVGEEEGGHGLLRKIAHFSEFACLGALICWRLGMAGVTGRSLAALALFGGLATACMDETIQIFVPDRASSLIDVWIDTSGAAVGMIFLLLGYHLIKRKHGKKHLEDTL